MKRIYLLVLLFMNLNLYAFSLKSIRKNPISPMCKRNVESLNNALRNSDPNFYRDYLALTELIHFIQLNLSYDPKSVKVGKEIFTRYARAFDHIACQPASFNRTEVDVRQFLFRSDHNYNIEYTINFIGSHKGKSYFRINYQSFKYDCKSTYIRGRAPKKEDYQLRSNEIIEITNSSKTYHEVKICQTVEKPILESVVFSRYCYSNFYPENNHILAKDLSIAPEFLNTLKLKNALSETMLENENYLINIDLSKLQRLLFTMDANARAMMNGSDEGIKQDCLNEQIAHLKRIHVADIPEANVDLSNRGRNGNPSKRKNAHNQSLPQNFTSVSAD